MKRKMMIVPLLLGLAAAPLQASPDHHKYKRGHGNDAVVVKAKVSYVEPIYEVVQTPQERRECWDEVVQGTEVRRSNGGALTGAILGGVIGHNVGNGRDRGATTAVGTIIGATIGSGHDREYHTPYSYTEQHCSVTTDYIEEQRLLGYRVSYRFEGEEYTTRMNHDPGKFVRLRVSHQLLD